MRGTLFKDENKLQTMLNLRRNNWGYVSLAIIFNCNRCSIADQCEKYGVYPQNSQLFNLERIVHKVVPNLKKDDEPQASWKSIFGDNVCQGMSYKDYLRRDQLRKNTLIEKSNEMSTIKS